jgi:hypothetical protein
MKRVRPESEKLSQNSERTTILLLKNIRIVSFDDIWVMETAARFENPGGWDSILIETEDLYGQCLIGPLAHDLIDWTTIP